MQNIHTDGRMKAWGWLGLAVLLAALGSSLRLGFHFGSNNNVFHIPLVEGWAQWPRFAHDALVQSLGKFTSIVWPVMTPFAQALGTSTAFGWAHVVSRVLAMAALAVWLRALMPGSIVRVALALMGLAVTPWLIDTSPVGGHGLWLNYFTHSELTWPSVFGALAAVWQRRWTLAGLLTGLCFSINAFVGIWLAVALLAMAWPLRREWWGWLGGRALLAGLATASPALWWIAQSIGGDRVDFDYLQYIRLYYPNHFLIEVATPRQLMLMGLLMVGGWLAAAGLPGTRAWRTALGAWLALWAIGCVLPYAWPNRFVFNLHLLRVDGLIQMLSLALMFALAVREWRSDRWSVSAALGLAIALGLLTDLAEPVGLVLALASTGLLVTRHRWQDLGPWRGRSAALVAAWLLAMVVIEAVRIGPSWLMAARWLLLACVAIWLVYPAARQDDSGAQTRSWLAPILATWLLLSLTLPRVPALWSDWGSSKPKLNAEPLAAAVRHAAGEGVFLVPVTPAFDTFQLNSRQTVWVDWKQGAAVMWEPSFHAQWRSRYAEVAALPPDDPAAWVGYAREHGIDHVVLSPPGAGCPPSAVSRWADTMYRWCQVLPQSPIAPVPTP